MLNIYLTRHGQDEDNVRGILNGRRNEKLTEQGVVQAQELTMHLKTSEIIFSAVYSSPLDRANQTAKIITSSLELDDPIILDNLIERDFGVMTGCLTAEIETMCSPDLLKTETINYFLSPEGAETFPDLIRRAHKIIDEIKSRHEGGNILLVTHGDIGKMIYAAYYNLKWEDVLKQFHFGNSDLLILSASSKVNEAHVFKNKQFNA